MLKLEPQELWLAIAVSFIVPVPVRPVLGFKSPRELGVAHYFSVYFEFTNTELIENRRLWEQKQAFSYD